jgi:hypothetical protein
MLHFFLADGMQSGASSAREYGGLFVQISVYRCNFQALGDKSEFFVFSSSRKCPD